MKKLLSAALVASLLLFSACTKEQGSSPEAETSSSEGSSPAAESTLTSLTTGAKEAVTGGASNAASQLKEISGFSDTLNSTWNSMKGMDFSDKSKLVKQGMDLVSMAKDKIATLSNLSSMLSSDMGKQLMGKVGSLSGNLGNLSSLLGKAGTITQGNWGSYKDSIGSAIGSLSKGFAGLGSL